MGNNKGQIGIIMGVAFMLVLIVVLFIIFILPSAKNTLFDSTLKLTCEGNKCIEGQSASAMVSITNDGDIDFEVSSIKLRGSDGIVFASSSDLSSIVSSSGAPQSFNLDISNLPKPKGNMLNYQICLIVNSQSAICKGVSSNGILDCSQEQCSPEGNDFKQVQVISKSDWECDNNQTCKDDQFCDITTGEGSECKNLNCEEGQIVENHICIAPIIETPQEDVNSTPDNSTLQNETNSTQ